MSHATIRDGFGFILTSLIQNEEMAASLVAGIDQLRRLYPCAPILVIDDRSPIPATTVLNDLLRTDSILTVERSLKAGAAEGLPYLHYFRKAAFPKAIVLHDSFHLLSPIDDLAEIETVRFIKHAFGDWYRVQAPRTPENAVASIATHVDEILSYMRLHYAHDHPFYRYFLETFPKQGMWLVCFGVMSVITHQFLVELDRKTDILSCFEGVRDRRDRMVMESVFPMACMYLNAFDTSNLRRLSCYGEWGPPDARTRKLSFRR